MKKKLIPGFVGLILIIVSNILILTQDSSKALTMVKEDGLIEYLEAILYLLSAIILFYLFVKSKSNKRIYFLKTKYNYFYLFFGIFLFLCFGEEISWGQRILNIRSPDFFLEHNAQEETNIHNLFIWETYDENGNPMKGLRHFISYYALYSYVWFLFFFLVPLVSYLSKKMRNIFNSIKLPVIPLFTGALFVLNYIVVGYIEKINIIEYRIVGEVKEFNFAFLFFITSYSLYLIFMQNKLLIKNKETKM